MILEALTPRASETNGRGLLAHRGVAATDEWLSPPEMVRSLGAFDLDPCAPIAARRPWATATHHFTIEDNGLRKLWAGRVWLNPPYHRSIVGSWLARMAEHGDGIALIFARTDTAWFQSHVFGAANAVLFLKGRVIFRTCDGEPGKWNPAAASCLVAYGRRNVTALETCGLAGRLVDLK